MRLSVVFLAVLAASAQASWFASDAPQYQQWSTDELKQWLNDHHVATPSVQNYSRDELVDLVKANWNSATAWTYDQYNAAQDTFQHLRESTFESWDESQLRQFLLDQGIVAPKGPKEELVLLAKQRYNSYTQAASSLASQASAVPSSAIYGDTKYQASASVSSIIATATDSVAQTLDDSKDYVYSTWSDNQLRDYLVEKGAIKSDAQHTRDELLKLMNTAYAKVSDPVWQAWGDSSIRNWLVSHNVIDDRSSTQKTRDELVAQMQNYYYDTNSYVWDSWSESDSRAWLIDHGVMKSDAQVQREKMAKLVRDNYSNAHDTFWSAWSDSDMRSWLIDNGYLRSDAQVKRDELIKLINTKYNGASSRAAAYLTWPDARLRAFLREHGMSEKLLPASRPGLLQETRIRYVQGTHKSEQLFNSIRDIVNNGVGAVEDNLAKIWEALSGKYADGKVKSKQTKEWTDEKAADAKKQANEKSADAKQWANEKTGDAKEWAEEKTAQGKKASASATRKYSGEL